MSELKANEKVEWKPIWAMIATVLLAAVFVLSLLNLTSGIFWFITGTIGTVAVGIYCGTGTAIFSNLISFLGRISLVVLCVHGPVYRVVSKVISVVAHMDTDTVRSNFFFALVIVIITLVICSIAYIVIDRLLPWMIGKPKSSREPVTNRETATEPAVTESAVRGRVSE